MMMTHWPVFRRRLRHEIKHVQSGADDWRMQWKSDKLRENTKHWTVTDTTRPV